MSAHGGSPPRMLVELRPAGALAAGARDTPSPALTAASFFALAAFASLEYGTLLLHPPALRLLAVAAIAAAGGALLAVAAAAGADRPASTLALALRTAAAVAIVLATLAAGLLAIGIPAHLLAPARWASLAHQVRHGYDGLEGWLWPFRGSERWPRLTVLIVLPPALTLAAALHFWPSHRRRRVRRLGALALLVGVLLAGVVNQTAPAWRVQGVLLLALLACALWLPTLRGGAVNRAGAWLLGCALAGLALAPVLASRSPWIDYRAWNPLPASTAFEWNQLYGPIPWSRSTATIATVTAPRPELLRVTALDRFDGIRFLRSGAPPGSVSLDFAGARRAGGAYMHVDTVTLAGLRSTLLASGGGLAAGVQWLRGSPPRVTRAGDGTVSLAFAPASGSSYRVRSYAPTPTAAALRAAPSAFPARYLPYARFRLPGPDLARTGSAPVPAGTLVGAPTPGRTPASDPTTAAGIERSPYGPMFALARRLAAGRRAAYDVALATEHYLLTHYRYNERPPRSRYPLEAFLFGAAGGYCQQFSGAMTLMLRMDGIPARVAAGFRPSVYDAATGTWQVRAVDAHAWVEVYFPGIGWVAFDPTPPRPEGAGAFSSALAAPLRGRGSGASAGGHGQPTHPVRTGARPAPARGAGGSVPWPALAAAVGLAAALVLGWIWLRAAARLRDGLRGDAAGAVAELAAALARSGRPLAPGTTLRQLRERLQASGEQAAARYVELLERARYGEAGPPPTPRERRELRRTLAAGGGPVMRLRALLALPPGVARRA